MSEIATFSPQSRESLQRQGFQFYTLTGKSILDLRNEGYVFKPNYLFKPGQYFQTDLLTRPSRKSEVAFRDRILEVSDNKSLYDHLRLVDRYGRDLSKSIPDIEIVIAQAPDYAELVALFHNEMGRSLFEDTYAIRYKWLKWLAPDIPYTRTLTPFSSPNGRFLAMVGDTSTDIEIGGFTEDGTHGCGVMPLVFPASGSS